MNNVVDYETIEDIALEMSWQWDNNSSIPWVSSPQIDASTSVYNIPEWEPTTPDLVWWTTSIVWSATDYRVVAWTAWDIKLADWTTYSVDSWNTGNMSAVTYIYYNWTTTLQKTTTPQDAVGEGKIMLCVAKNITDTTGRAIFQPFGTVWWTVFITAANIAANTITANEIASNTITATQMNVSQLSAISANLWTITAGTITGATIRTASSGQRAQMDNNYFRSYDSSGIERLRVDWSTLKFYRSNWTYDWWIYWAWWYIMLDAAVLVNWTFGSKTISPNSNNTYNLGSTSYKWKNLYLSGDLTMDWYINRVDYINFNDKINFWSAWASVTTANTSSNRYINVTINSTWYKLLLAT